MSFVAAIALCQLTFLEHGRSVRPSSLLLFYLLASVICEGVLLKTFYQDRVDPVAGPALTAAFGLKLVLLAVESRSKRSYLREPFKDLPALETIGDLNKIVLFWVNDLILLGNRKLLAFPDLPNLDRPLTSKRLRERLGTAWKKTSRHHALSRFHEGKYSHPERKARTIRGRHHSPGLALGMVLVFLTRYDHRGPSPACRYFSTLFPASSDQHHHRLC